MGDAEVFAVLANIRGIAYEPTGPALAEYNEVLPELKEDCPASLYEYYVTYRDYLEAYNEIINNTNNILAQKGISNDSDFTYLNADLLTINLLKSLESFKQSFDNLPKELKMVPFYSGVQRIPLFRMT